MLAKKKWKNIICDFYKYLIKSFVWEIEMWLKVEENEKQEIVVELMNEYEVYKMQSLFHPLSIVWKVTENSC